MAGHCQLDEFQPQLAHAGQAGTQPGDVEFLRQHFAFSLAKQAVSLSFKVDA